MNRWQRAGLIAAFVAPTVLAGIGVQTALDAVHRVERDAVIDEAQLCLALWEARTGARQAVDRAMNGVVSPKSASRGAESMSARSVMANVPRSAMPTTRRGDAVILASSRSRSS